MIQKERLLKDFEAMTTFGGSVVVSIALLLVMRIGPDANIS